MSWFQSNVADVQALHSSECVEQEEEELVTQVTFKKRGKKGQTGKKQTWMVRPEERENLQKESVNN